MNSRRESDFSRFLSRGSIRVGIIGQGIVGTLSAQLASSAGFDTIAYDSDQARSRHLRSQRSFQWEIADDLAALEDADVLLIAIRLPISRGGKIDRGPLKSLATQLRGFSARERLIIMETTLPPRTSRWFGGQLTNGLNASGVHLAYCPERFRVGQAVHEVRGIPRLVGGVTPAGADLACIFLKRIGLTAVRVSSAEVAELSKLLENTFLTQGICLMGEVTRIAHAIGINATEVARAAATKPEGYFPFWPGAGIGGYCLPNDRRMLAHTAGCLGVDAPLLNALEPAAAALTPGVVLKLKKLLSQRGLQLSAARIWIVGVGFKAGSSETKATPAVDLVRLLRKARASVCYSDRAVRNFSVDDTTVSKVRSGSWPRGIDAALILSGDRTVSLSRLAKGIPCVLDLGGARTMSGNRNGIESL